MSFSKGCTRSAGSVRSKKLSTQLCFWPTPRSPRVKYCTWMAARTRANGDRNTSSRGKSVQLESNRRTNNVQRKQKQSAFVSWHSYQLPVGAAQRKQLHGKCSDCQVLFCRLVHQHLRGAW